MTIKQIESLANLLGVRQADLTRLAENPAARVTVSAPGGFHRQSTISEVMARYAVAAPAGGAADAKKRTKKNSSGKLPTETDFS